MNMLATTALLVALLLTVDTSWTSSSSTAVDAFCPNQQPLARRSTFLQAKRTATPQQLVPPDIPVRSRSDLPDVPPDCSLDVFYAEQIITELGTVGELVETYHSGLIFRVVKDSNVPQDVPSEFTVQWYALDFPFGAFLPQIQSPTPNNNTNNEGEEQQLLQPQLVWNNTACAQYTAGVDAARWTKGETLAGRITGDAFSKFRTWTVDYCQERAGYQAFEVWDRPRLVPGTTVRWAESNTCSSFTEAALVQLYELGGDFKLGNSLLRRSYVPLISKRKPTVVNMEDPKEAKLVQEFYQTIQQVVVTQGMTTSDFIRFLADKLDFFYVYDSFRDDYLRVELSRPYFAMAQLYQPMNLPWQMLDLEGDGVADQQLSEFAEEDASFLAEISYAMEGSVDLLRRRLPSVVKRKLESKIIPIAVVGAALVPVTMLVMRSSVSNPVVHIDASFVAGICVGFAAGLLSSRFLSE